MGFEKRWRQEWRNIVFNLFFFIFSIGLVLLLYTSRLWTTLFVVAITIVGMTKWRSPITIFIFIIGGLFGTLLESLILSYGVEGFSALMGLPFWLFVLWGNFSSFLYQTAIEFERLGFHR